MYELTSKLACFGQLSTLPILASEDTRRNEDEECTIRQIVRHVCTALKRYFEAHLFKKVETANRRLVLDSVPPDSFAQKSIAPFNYYRVSLFFVAVSGERRAGGRFGIEIGIASTERQIESGNDTRTDKLVVEYEIHLQMVTSE